MTHARRKSQQPDDRFSIRFLLEVESDIISFVHTNKRAAMVKITLKNGRSYEFPGGRIQVKDGGRMLAVYDKRYVIIAEFPASLVREYREEPAVIPKSHAS